MHLIKPMVSNGWGFLSTSFLLLDDETETLPVRGQAGTLPRGHCPSRSGRNCLEDLEDREIVWEMKNLTQPGGQERTFLQADRRRCASVSGLQYLYIYGDDLDPGSFPKPRLGGEAPDTAWWPGTA